MGEADKGWLMIRIGVSEWMFLLIQAYPGNPGQRTIKWLLLLLCTYHIHIYIFGIKDEATLVHGISYCRDA